MIAWHCSVLMLSSSGVWFLSVFPSVIISCYTSGAFDFNSVITVSIEKLWKCSRVSDPSTTWWPCQSTLYLISSCLAFPSCLSGIIKCYQKVTLSPGHSQILSRSCGESPNFLHSYAIKVLSTMPLGRTWSTAVTLNLLQCSLQETGVLWYSCQDIMIFIKDCYTPDVWAYSIVICSRWAIDSMDTLYFVGVICK